MLPTTEPDGSSKDANTLPAEVGSRDSHFLLRPSLLFFVTALAILLLHRLKPPSNPTNKASFKRAPGESATGDAEPASLQTRVKGEQHHLASFEGRQCSSEPKISSPSPINLRLNEAGRWALPPYPPTEALLDFFVPARSIWPSYYIRAAHDAEARARSSIAAYQASQVKPRQRDRAVSNAHNIATDSPNVSLFSFGGLGGRAAPCRLSKPPDRWRASLAPSSPLNVRVREMLAQIPSSELSAASDASDEERGTVAPQSPETRVPAEASEGGILVEPYLLHQSEPYRQRGRCWPICISTKQLVRDWKSGKIQPIDGSWTLQAMVECIRASTHCSITPLPGSGAIRRVVKTEPRWTTDHSPVLASCTSQIDLGSARPWCIHLLSQQE
ncbi:hypothetical protein ACQY0O_001665 [Thecaphora frezii]